MTVLAPSRIGVEVLDGTGADPAVVRATLRDLAVVNALGGGRRAVALEFRRLLRCHPDRTRISILDVGAGGGDILAHLVRIGAGHGVRVDAIALDAHTAAARLCREAGLATLVADAGHLPVAPGSVDVLVVSQLLHHFERAAAVRLLVELGRIARLAIIIADLRRSLGARLAIRLLAAALPFHPVTGHDGIVSVRRGFSTTELEVLLARAGFRVRVRRRAGFRLAALWERGRAYG